MIKSVTKEKNKKPLPKTSSAKTDESKEAAKTCCTKCNCVYCKYTVVAILAFLLGFLLKTWLAGPVNMKSVATIDVQKLINNMNEVNLIQDEMYAKQDELQNWIKEAQDAVAKEPNKQRKDELAQQYEKELIDKQQALQQEYADKLNEIDEKISKIIEKKARKLGYKVVLNKNAVITGGTDITDKIIDLIK